MRASPNTLTRADRRLGALLLMVFAFQFLVVQAHVAHAHHEVAHGAHGGHEHHGHHGDPHHDVGHLPFHGGDDHSELDHVLPSLLSRSGLERAPGANASTDLPPMAATFSPLQTPGARLIARPAPAVLDAGPLLGPCARGPPMA